MHIFEFFQNVQLCVAFVRNKQGPLRIYKNGTFVPYNKNFLKDVLKNTKMGETFATILSILGNLSLDLQKWMELDDSLYSYFNLGYASFLERCNKECISMVGNSSSELGRKEQINWGLNAKSNASANKFSNKHAKYIHKSLINHSSDSSSSNPKRSSEQSFQRKFNVYISKVD